MSTDRTNRTPNLDASGNLASKADAADGSFTGKFAYVRPTTSGTLVGTTGGTNPQWDVQLSPDLVNGPDAAMAAVQGGNNVWGIVSGGIVTTFAVYKS